MVPEPFRALSETSLVSFGASRSEREKVDYRLARNHPPSTALWRSCRWTAA